MRTRLNHFALLVSTQLRRAVEPAAIALLYGLAALLRVDSLVRRSLRRRPRVLWGPTPIINNKYWSQALGALGYRSRTFATVVYPAYELSDFDNLRTEFLPSSRYDGVRDYAVFAWSMLHADVYVAFFDGGYLAGTRLRDRELRLLRLAGKRLVVLSFGSDVAVSGHLGPYQRGMEIHYPDVIARSDEIRERVDWFSEGADLVIRTLQPGYLPRWHVLWAHGVAIDTDQWSDEHGHSENDGHNGPVRIVHATNHRDLKGTDALIEAVESLRSDGLKVELEVIEGRSNRDVLEAVKKADIVGDQFICGFGLFAVEAMSAGRPTLTALGWMPADIREALADQGVPVIDSDERPLAEAIRDLVEHPEVRREVGAASRKYVLERHSYEAVGSVWSMIVDHVWLGRPLGPPLIPAGEQRGG